jgi:hypothetical protein
MFNQGGGIMFINKFKVAGMFALTLALLLGALSLNAASVVFAADRSAYPASSGTPNDVRLHLCNVDSDRDSDDVCRVIGGRFFFSSRFSLRNRLLSPKNLDFDHDAAFPLKLGPFPKNFTY